jgi:diguanylate cyclase (GGDEF)-like protein
MAEITRMAELDHLTGLLNRRAFNRDAQKKRDEIKRYGSSAYLLLLDIDFFKKVNDTYGHLAGDEVLRSVAKTLAARFRSTDTVGRYGGEEFCVLMPAIGEASAISIAEDIRKSIEQLSVRFEDKTIRVTISIGMAEMTPDQDMAALIADADAALYKAKETGRNRVVFYRG